MSQVFRRRPGAHKRHATVLQRGNSSASLAVGRVCARDTELLWRLGTGLAGAGSKSRQETEPRRTQSRAEGTHPSSHFPRAWEGSSLHLLSGRDRIEELGGGRSAQQRYGHCEFRDTADQIYRRGPQSYTSDGTEVAVVGRFPAPHRPNHGEREFCGRGGLSPRVVGERLQPEDVGGSWEW